MMNPKELSELIRKRRAIFPKSYTKEKIPKDLIQIILENANWAPTHKMTEPWRFRVFVGESRERLGDLLALYYLSVTPKELFSEIKYDKQLKNPKRSPCVIAICMQRDPEERIPEFEEIASVACAVQNMWLTATAYGIGAYWSTPGIIDSEDIRDFLELADGERCLGFFYMGYHNLEEIPGKRSPIEEKVIWYEN